MLSSEERIWRAHTRSARRIGQALGVVAAYFLLRRW
jgi:hypothetical protein